MKDYIEKAMTFSEYEKLLDDLLAAGKTTGPYQSDAMFGYGKLNRQRMHRLNKTVVLGNDIREAVSQITRPVIWLIITEGWCGDAAQNIPVIEKIAAENDKIKTLYTLRDENIDLMDQFLTGGARSIPKLIAVDADTFEVIGTWGPRPLISQQLFEKMKAEGTPKAEILEEMQRWYYADRSRSIQREFVELVRLRVFVQEESLVGSA